jgi:hypothetical protein
MVDLLQLAEIAGAKSKFVDISSVILAQFKLLFFLLFSLFLSAVFLYRIK